METILSLWKDKYPKNTIQVVARLESSLNEWSNLHQYDLIDDKDNQDIIFFLARQVDRFTASGLLTTEQRTSYRHALFR